MFFFIGFFNYPLDDFKKLRLLNIMNGAFDGLLHFIGADNARYDSHTFVSEAFSILATLIWLRIRKSVQSARYLGLMIDEATDCSTKSAVTCVL